MDITAIFPKKLYKGSQTKSLELVLQNRSIITNAFKKHPNILHNSNEEKGKTEKWDGKDILTCTLIYWENRHCKIAGEFRVTYLFWYLCVTTRFLEAKNGNRQWENQENKRKKNKHKEGEKKNKYFFCYFIGSSKKHFLYLNYISG